MTKVKISKCNFSTFRLTLFNDAVRNSVSVAQYVEGSAIVLNRSIILSIY
jgi:hypothetical protein